MATTSLSKEMIADPRLWRLSIKIGENAMEVVLHSSVEENSLIYRRIGFDQAAASPLKAIEDIIYDNTLLLCDFGKTDCIISTDRFTLLPGDFTSDVLQQKIAATMWHDDSLHIISNDLADCNAILLMAIDDGTANFLTRTFNNPALLHPLTPLCRYFCHKSRLGNTGKMYVHFRDCTLDILSFGRDGLKIANTYRFADSNDAVYYILATAKTTGFSSAEDELLLSGSPSTREEVTPILRKYISYVMPVIFPSAMFKAGKESLNAPFETIVLPLCE